MNYTQLVAAVSHYAENTFETADMDNFIRQAEQRVYNAVQFPALRKNVTGSCSTANKYLQCPTDYLATYSMAVIDPATGGYTYLLNKDVNFLREAYPLPTSTGSPKYYATFGPRSDAETELAFILGPTPDRAYAVELHYFYYPTSIVVTGTSWLGDNFDSVLLYGTLIEAYTFMKGEADMMQLYDSKFKEALLLAKRLGDGMEKQDVYRSGQAKTAVT
jgi:hypothetical protein